MTPLLSLMFALLVLLWSGIQPEDRFTWWLEIAPAIIALPILLATYRKFRLTDMLYILIAIHAAVLMVGGHYTYAKVPIGFWFGDLFHAGRNSYDGIGHLAQGFVPALLLRELLLRTSPLRQGKWLNALVILGCLGISAGYELVEWMVSISTGEGADAFLGTQGDIWDTQKDIALAGLGAAVAVFFFGRLHDRAVRNRYAIAPPTKEPLPL
jgi:putative membrane protein